MRNAVLTEADRGAILEAWKYSKYSRESIEGQLLGGSIVAVYPLFGIDETGNSYDTGLSIVYQAPGSGEIKTLDITTGNCCSRDDEIITSIEDGFIQPEYGGFPLYRVEMEGLE